MSFIKHYFTSVDAPKSVILAAGLAIGIGSTAAAIMTARRYLKQHRVSVALTEYGGSETTSNRSHHILRTIDEKGEGELEEIVDPHAFNGAYPHLGPASKNRTLLAKCLNEEIYDQLIQLKTKFGSNLDDCIQVGVDNPEGDPFESNDPAFVTCGFVAADAQCYDLFESFFLPIVQMRHFEVVLPSEIVSGWKNFQWQNVSIVEIRVHRNLATVPFAPRITRLQRRYVFNTLIKMCCELILDHDVFLLSDTLSREEIDQLRRLNLYNDLTIDNPYRVCIGQYRDPLDARGVVLSGDESSAVIVNSLDHLVFVGRDTTGDLVKAYERIDRMIHGASEWLKREGMKFAYHDKFGYLTVLPEMLGAATTITCSITLPPNRRRDHQFGSKVANEMLETGLIVKEHNDHFDVISPETFLKTERGFTVEAVVQYMVQCLTKVRDSCFSKA